MATTTAQRATLFDPLTKQRKAVDVGSTEAQSLFSQGYKLETPVSNAATWSKLPDKEIVQQSGTPNLFAQDNTTQTRTPISGPSQIAPTIAKGFQDTRAQINFGGDGTSGNGGNQNGGATVPGSSPATNPADSFNTAITNLLKGVGTSSPDEDFLSKRRAELLNEKYTTGTALFSGEDAKMTGSQKLALINNRESGIGTELAGVNSSLDTRQRNRENVMAQAKEANAMLKDFQASQRTDREDTRKFINDQFTAFGSGAFGNASATDLAHLEGQAGIPPGTLSGNKKTIKEQETAAKSEKTTYAPGSIGEYQFYSEQEQKQGRTPMSYQAYQTMDANRKAKAVNMSGLDTASATRVDRLTNQFDNEPIVKNYNVMQEAQAFTSALQNNPSSADDQGLIYAFAKAMDPNSAVREGEYSTVQKYAQSWAQQFGFKAERIFSNSPFLSADARANMIKTIQTKASVSQKQYDNLSNEYGRRVNQITGDSNGKDYISNYSGAFSGGSQNNGGGDPLDAALDAQGFKTELQTSIKGSDTGNVVAAIGEFESGGNYHAIGPKTSSGDQAYGKYQIMGANIPQWSKEALGYSITPKQFLALPELQDEIANYKIGKLVAKHGNVGDVASVWFSGRPLKGNTSKDVIGTSVPQYAKNVIAIYKKLA